VFTLHVGPSAEISEAIDFLENDFDITSFKPESATGKQEKRVEQLNRYNCIQDGHLRLGHRVETYRDVTSVPTFFVRMLGKLLDACI
jgi:hypothetical protein